MPLQDGVVVAFGGEHFVYRADITREPGMKPANSGAPKPREGKASPTSGKRA